MWGLPDLKNILASFYQENLQPTIDSKSREYKELLQTNFAYSQRTQSALIAIAFATLLLLAIAYFWN
jgi:hypothetical protein